MERVIVIEQPNYIPWIGYFDLMAQCDVWIWYDDVQYTKRDWRNRNRIAGDGGPLWLTIPVKTKGRFHQKIGEVEIDYARPWVRKHLAAFRDCYRRAPGFGDLLGIYGGALEREPRFLADLTIGLNETLAGCLGLAPRFARSSSFGGSEERADRQQRLLDLCARSAATAYLSGPAARAYIDPESFHRAGVALRYMVYNYPPYARGGHPFVPHLSILDALAWLGPAETAALIRHGQRWETA
ncbi:MAG TPA: WbqC family protein [Thermoanaerobaculia bacterium]|nr:WbqC family protein [Thermoanaerobaculia bacterium]